MLFNSVIFVAFFAVVYGLYRFLPHRSQNLMLLVASYVFYGSWDWRFLSLIWISTLVDYFCGKAIHDSAGSRARRGQETGGPSQYCGGMGPLFITARQVPDTGMEGH